MREPVLKYECVDVSYGGKVALRQVTAEVHAGETLCIVGESGSGKSTLVKAAMGLLGGKGEVNKGRILFEGSDLTSLSNDDLRVHCGPDMAMVFQDALASLTPIRTIGNQLYEAVRIHQDIPRKGVEEKACDLLDRMNIDDPRRVLELSVRAFGWHGPARRYNDGADHGAEGSVRRRTYERTGCAFAKTGGAGTDAPSERYP